MVVPRPDGSFRSHAVDGLVLTGSAGAEGVFPFLKGGGRYGFPPRSLQLYLPHDVPVVVDLEVERDVIIGPVAAKPLCHPVIMAEIRSRVVTQPVLAAHPSAWPPARISHVLDSLPKSAQPAAKKALQDIYNAEDCEHAERAIEVFAKLYQAKFPKAVAKVTDDQDVLLEFYDYPAEHWIHLRTTNPIESTFATVRLRTKVTCRRTPARAGPGTTWRVGGTRSRPPAVLTRT
jgi:hypothetical protein